VPVPDGGTRIVPSTGWDDLVLPDPARDQLREAVARVRHGDVVLDRWGFLNGRPGRRGLRLLFSGPPGTGKTLAAEVLAGAIGRELLVVDLSRTVSKWIGETEKNLAAAFDAAERGDYVLLFDEADALFARRTEVGDARDRYANLETSYLLSRLSWFDGVAVLATNLRQNLDVAFGRRLEFVVPFDQPDGAQRRRLWRVHLPPSAPLGADVDLDQVADFYPMSGALIRNAALAAAYLAADAGAPIGAEHLSRAIHREYLKAGLAYPGRLPESSPSPKESPCP
jgi:SpoVK/Ycf46/Vps4 family AAA+-type ATPase